MKRVIPYGRQKIDDDDIAAVVDVLKGDYLTTGPAVAQFEADFSSEVQSAGTAAVSSGTAALHLAMAALGITSGDQVIVPSITFLASANAAEFLGAEVVFSDTDPDTGLMRPADLTDVLCHAPRAKAVVVVHLNGVPADIVELKAIADAHGLAVIEDACHALGSFYSDGSGLGTAHPVGSCRHSAAAIFSFHPVKAIATGEGGAVTSSDPTFLETVRLLRTHNMRRGEGNVTFDGGFSPDGRLLPWSYEMQTPGWNYRMTDIQAVLGRSQLRKLAKFCERRRVLVQEYDESLKALSNHLTPVSMICAAARRLSIGWHLYPVLCHGGQDERLALYDALSNSGIHAQVHYFPVHRQPYYLNRIPDRDLPGADAYYARVLSLPLYFDLSGEEQQTVVRAIVDFFDSTKKSGVATCQTS